VGGTGTEAEAVNGHWILRPSSGNTLAGLSSQSGRIWKGRKAAFGAFGRISDYYCMDGVIPLSRLPEALAAVNQICKRYRFDVANVFHAGDGNLHPLILYNANDPAELGGIEQPIRTSKKSLNRINPLRLLRLAPSRRCDCATYLVRSQRIADDLWLRRWGAEGPG